MPQHPQPAPSTRASTLPRETDLTRRAFLNRAALASVALAAWPSGRTLAAALAGKSAKAAQPEEWTSLLREWVDGMLALQIHAPDEPERHGALRCDSCDFIHGRCMDAVYPFFHMAKVTGEKRYLDAGIKVFEWSKNVSQPDGSWTVIKDPTSWRGITIFGAIALAETLHYHGDLLKPAMRERWTARLAAAAAYIHREFTLDFTNINYGATAVYGLHLFGDVLGKPAYKERSRELLRGIPAYVTENGLLFGEGKPSNARSARGLPPVDLGYNVEESIIAIALYAAEEKDPVALALAQRLLNAHLEFMLPDGGWDNSWGTRHAKWSYWGSRTCDGCQPGFAALAHLNPAYGTAAVKNLRQLRACTRDGLLYGGPHYAARGAKPCVHHTFTHAKALAAVLDRGLASQLTDTTPLPRAAADGIKAFPEVAVWLAARGPWRATVNSYDFVYGKQANPPTGGVLSLLWHEKTGPLCAGSMPSYAMVERNNMQPDPAGADEPLTPRLEVWENGTWFTQLYDLNAAVTAQSSDAAVEFKVATSLRNAKGAAPAAGECKFELGYRFDREALTVRAKFLRAGNKLAPSLVWPIISLSGEKVERVSEKKLLIHRAGGRVVAEADVPLAIAPIKTGRERIFNLVPGFEALPIVAAFPAGRDEIEVRLSVLPS